MSIRRMQLWRAAVLKELLVCAAGEIQMRSSTVSPPCDHGAQLMRKAR